MRRSLLRAVQLLLAVTGLQATAHAISVEVVQRSADYCVDEFQHTFTGELEALVTGGTAPYRYDWYILDWMGSYVELCADCGPLLTGLEGLREFKVVVTDAVSATTEAFGGVQGIAGPQVQFYTLPYEAGTQPVIIAEISNDMALNDPELASAILAMTPGPTHTYGPWPGWQSMYKAVLPVGTTGGTLTVANFDGVGTCQNTFPYTVGPPTVLPIMEVLSVEGSCSVAGTGSATVRFTEGVLPQGLNIVIKDASGHQVSLHGQYNVGTQPDVQTFGELAPGDHWLVVTGDLLISPTMIAGFNYTCRDSIPFTIPNLGATCGVVRGAVFLDNNMNCTKQPSEPGIPGTVLEVMPGPYYTTTDQQGRYDLVVPVGSYTIREQSTVVNEHCTGDPIPFAVAGAAHVTVDHPTIALVPMDVQVALGSGPARPGFEFQYGLYVRNLTVANTGTITVTMQLDPALEYLSATPVPTMVSGQTLTWTLAALPVFGERNITVRTQVPPDIALLGTDLTTAATVTTALTDGNLANNTTTNVRTVTGSYDPNDKLARTSTGNTDHYDPDTDSWIDYTIRFQNTGTDTAFHVWITDTLAATLDAATFRIGAASHPFTWELDGESVLKVRFAHILLPDSNVNEPRSHGFVNFRIQPRQPVVTGAIIENIANIFFDFNPPVITPPSVLQVLQPGLGLSVRILLEGVDGAGDGLMDDALRTHGLLPLQEPYTALGHPHSGGGGESIHPSVLAVTGSDAIVDWVVVELRAAHDPAAVVRTMSALLQRDGDVVGLDGASPLQVPVPDGNYFVSLRHRNHLGVMTASTIALSTALPATVDFTTALAATHGNDARIEVNGRLCLWAGDCDGDGTIRYTGDDNDRDPILQAIGGTVPTNTLPGVYSPLDANLDGTVKYTGLGNDRDVILRAIGGSTPTATRAQQLP